MEANDALLCPSCTQQLAPSGKQWKCPCGARWVCNAEFAEMIARMQDGYGPDKVSFDDRGKLWKRVLRVAQERRLPSDRNCPVCKELMKHVAYQSVELDHCEEHGLFFDPSELQLALQRAADNRPNAPREDIFELLDDIEPIS